MNGLMNRRSRLIHLLLLLSLALPACGGENVPEVPEPGPISTAPESAEPLEFGGGMQWDEPPAMTIDVGETYLATFKTEKGDIKVELFAEQAPMTVNNLVFLAEEGYYDDTTFHRVLPDFMAQGGDPTGTGAGGPGYQFEDEISPDLRFDDAGYLAMANSGPGTNGSQFFLTYAPTPWLNGRHTIFGKVVEGMDVLRSLTPRDPTNEPEFEGDQLETVEIEVLAESLLPTPTPTPFPTPPVLEPERPLGQLSIEDRADLYTGPPAMVIAPDTSYQAEIETSKGMVIVDLKVEEAPGLVNNFVVLATLGYWDGFPIVFVEPDAFVLTGSPAGDPSSDVGYVLDEEGEMENVAGAVGYWYRQDALGASGSQFYILLSDLPDLDRQRTVFGQVEEGLDIAGELTTDDEILAITILQAGEPFSQ